MNESKILTYSFFYSGFVILLDSIFLAQIKLDIGSIAGIGVGISFIGFGISLWRFPRVNRHVSSIDESITRMMAIAMILISIILTIGVFVD